MSKWGRPTKNRKRIDPRYFLTETTNRDLKEYATAEEPPMEEEPPMGEKPSCPMEDEPVDLESEVQRLYDEWQPQTPEGQKYKDDLGAIMGSPGASAPPAAGPDWPLSHEFE